MRTLVLALVVANSVDGKACEGKNLPVNAHLRISQKKRVPIDECKKQAKAGDTVTIHYVGKLYRDCSTFDDTYAEGEPFTFTIGKDAVIEGWEDGVKGMCVGEIRSLTVPANLGYGDLGAGQIIPPKATLLFDVELLKITRKKADAQDAKAKREKRRARLKRQAQQFSGARPPGDL